MALTKTLNIKDNFGIEITFNDTYIKVVSVSGDKHLLTAQVSTQAKKDGTHLGMKLFSFTTDMQGDNPIRQAYKHLKTLPEFEGATDC
jgi:hypothetical protein